MVINRLTPTRHYVSRLVSPPFARSLQCLEFRFSVTRITSLDAWRGSRARFASPEVVPSVKSFRHNVLDELIEILDG